MRVITITLTALLSLLLISCDMQNKDICPGENVLVGNVCFDITKPEFRGIDDKSIYINETFDNLEGVTVIDDMDGDITNLITVEGVVDTSERGTYFLRYTVEDTSGNQAIGIRYITVEIDYDSYTNNLITNASFDEHMAGWTVLTNNSGGNANFRVVDGELMVEILSVPEQNYYWSPRLEFQHLTIVKGKEYYVSFDVRCDDPRLLHLQFGELLLYDPWFTDFRPGADKIYFVTQEMKTFSFTFTMGLETNHNGAIIFEMGHIGETNLVTNFYFDNIVVKQIGE